MDKLTKDLSNVKVATTAQAASPHVIYAEKKTPGKEGTATKLVVNAFKLDVKKNTSYYKYDVNMGMVVTLRSGDKKTVSIVKDHKKDIAERICTYSVWAALVKGNEEYFGSQKHAVVYDRVNNMYSTKEMKERTFEVEKAQFPTVGVPVDAEKLIVKISPCATTFQATSNDLPSVSNRNPKEEKRTVLEFLQLLVANEAFKQPTEFITVGRTHYLYNPDKYGFRSQDIPEIAQSQYFGVGIATTVSVKEGSRDAAQSHTVQAYVICDVKKSAFHYDDQSLMDKIRSIVRLPANGDIDPLAASQITQALKGVSIETTYGHKKQKFGFHSLGVPSNKLNIEREGQPTINAVAYYKKNYDITLQYPNMPMVRIARGNHYPIELLKVSSSQVVTNLQMSAETQAVGIKLNAVVPNDRKKQIMDLAPSAGVYSGNPTFANAGVTVSGSFLQLNGRILHDPIIKYGNNKKETLQNHYKWQSGQFLIPGTISGKWAIVTLLTPADIKYCDVDAYVTALTLRMKEKGIKAGEPRVMKGGPLTEKYIEDTFVMAKQNGATFLFFIESDHSHLHDFIKIMEQKHQVLSQAVRSSKASRIQRETLTNVVHKTTMKLGGLCFAVEVNHKKANEWLNGNETMFVGLEFSHAPAQNMAVLDKRDNALMASTVGYGANCSTHPQKFVGDYAYVEARDNTCLALLLKSLMENLAKQFMTARKSNIIKTVVIYFNGISDGQWPLIVGEFQKNILDGCRAAGVGKKPHLVLIAVSKLHEMRIFKENTGTGRAPEQNLIPGTVVDTVIVNPAVSEFFLNSHNTLQGSACTPKYSVLVDDAPASEKHDMDTIQNATHGLCCLHEIVTATVSTPAPLMVADRCAERGHKNYVAANRSRRGEVMSAEEANASLKNPDHGRFEGVRYNA